MIMIGLQKSNWKQLIKFSFYSGAVFLCLFLYQTVLIAQDPMLDQTAVLEYPSSSVSGDLVRLEHVEPNQLPRVSPVPKAIPKAQELSKSMPKTLVRSAEPVVVVDKETSEAASGSIQPVAGDAPLKRSSRPIFDDEPEVELKPIPRNYGTSRPIAAPPTPRVIESAPAPSSLRPSAREPEGELIVTPKASPQPHSASGGPALPVDAPIRPVEDADDEFHPHYQSAKFHGVQPGTSTMGEVTEILGVPQAAKKVESKTAHLYSIDELNHIEILFEGNTVYSIEIAFSEFYPVDQVREMLATELKNVRPVSFADEHGDVIGLMFPEKGLTLIYTPSEEPGVPSALVKKIVILPITAGPFIIRAKGYLEDSPTETKRDLLAAIFYEPDNPEPHGLLAQVELVAGDGASAMIRAQRALELDQTVPQYHIAFARALQMMNRVNDAKAYLKEMLPLCEKYQHQKAVALCLLGDLYRQGTGVNCEQAYEYHRQALNIAIPLREHSNPAVRSIAREVFVDSQLGVVRDIALGNWDNKWSAIEKWFASVREVLKDQEVTSKKRLIREYLFRVAVTGLSAQAVVSEAANLDTYIQDLLTATEELINVTDDPINRRRIQWEAGCVLFEVVQSFQRKKQYSTALRYGEPTVDLIELGIDGRTSESDYYLLSRLYFRLGTIHAIGMNNHRAAIIWFDRTLPIFDDILPGLGPEETGRVGEMLVSMGVSYWHTNQKDEAIRLSELGLEKIQAAVDRGYLEVTALLIPYSNLSTMWNKLDEPDKANEFYRAAARIQQSVVENNSTIRK